MTLRPWLVLGTAFILVGANGYLLFEESREDENGYTGIAPGYQRAQQQLNATDPLRNMLYSSSARAENLKKLGLDEKMAAAALKLIEDKYAPLTERKIDPLLRQFKEPEALADGLCGYTSQVRPHYGALRFLIEEKGGLRRPVDIDNTYALEEQSWAQGAFLGEIYEKVALRDTPPADATLMVVAAILTKNEQKILEARRPWGEGRAWSWEQVLEDYPGIDQKAIEYFALMHVTVEVATSDGGVCDQQGQAEEEPPPSEGE